MMFNFIGPFYSKPKTLQRQKLASDENIFKDQPQTFGKPFSLSRCWRNVNTGIERSTIG